MGENQNFNFAKFTSQEYDCPKCGKVTETITVLIKGLNGVFCLECFVKNVVMPNCERLTEY